MITGELAPTVRYDRSWSSWADRCATIELKLADSDRVEGSMEMTDWYLGKRIRRSWVLT